MPLSIRLTADEEERLENLATRTGRPKTFYVREALHQYLDDVEEAFWADEVIDRWEAAGKPTRPLSELKKELKPD